MESEEMRCSHMCCQDRVINQYTGRVEVCTVLPDSGLSCKTKWKVEWTKAGEAIFHQDCWEKLHKASRTRNSKNDPFKLHQSEKDMIKVASKTAERHDSVECIQKQAEKVAGMIQKAGYCCVFTGAGISTSAGIGDYRGKKGKWTEEDRVGVKINEAESIASDGEPAVKKQKTDQAQATEEVEEEGGVPYERLRPTYTHEAVKTLLDRKLVRHVISQNGDGLHGLSGVASENLSELHGNVFIEKCDVCGKRYMRNQYVLDDVASQYFEELEDYGKTAVKKPKHGKKCALCGLSHNTGRKCNHRSCRGNLLDTIINFRDHLEEDILDTAKSHARRCDLMLSLGTTMTVTPASDLVYMGKDPLRLVICNRQKTDVDAVCTTKDPSNPLEPLGVRVYGDCDRFIREVMKHLLKKVELDEWENGRELRMEEYDRQRDESQ